jgi:undecaprenyl diphosphate synthase
MRSFEKYLDKEVDELNKNGVQFRVIGRRDGLSQKLQRKIKIAVDLTQHNQAFIFNLAINYGGQEEIVDAAKTIAERVKKGELSLEEINVNLFGQHLYTADLPYPDLLIRTSGEYRLSNFLLYQVAYTELWITPTLWPDFGREELIQALKDYAKRERRFGGVKD